MAVVKRHFTENKRFRECFPEYCPSTRGKWCTEEEFTVPNRTKNIATPTMMIGSGSSPRTGFHYDLIINDDLCNEDNTNTPDQTQKVIDNWAHQSPLMRVPTKQTKRIQIGTIWDFNDVNIHVMMKKAPNFYKEYKDDTYKHPEDPLADNYPGDTMKVFLLSCYTDDFGLTNDRQATWPEAYPLEELERVRIEDSVSDTYFNMQMRNKVITDATRSFDPAWFNYFRQEIVYDKPGESNSIFIIRDDFQIPEEELVMRMTIDPAFRVKDYNDSTGFVIAGHWFNYETLERHILVFEAFAEKLSPNDLIRRIDDECAKWHILELGIETHGLQFLFTDQLVEKTRHSWIGRQQVNITRISRGSETVVGKARVLRLVPFYERGQIHHAEHLQAGDLEKQLLMFTGRTYRGKSPDIADAMSDQIDFTVAGGSSFDPGNPRLGDYMYKRNMDKMLDHVRDPWADMEQDIRSGNVDKNDWKRR